MKILVFLLNPLSSLSGLFLLATIAVNITNYQFVFMLPFASDHEGISIYTQDDGRGYILVSDQQANKFHLFTREGTAEDPHDHRLVKVVDVSTKNSDGSEVTSVNLGEKFPEGLFVAMSDDKTFHYYSWKDIMKE